MPLTRPQGPALHLLDHTVSLSGLPLMVVPLQLLFSFWQGQQTLCLTVSTGAHAHGAPLKESGREHLSPTLSSRDLDHQVIGECYSAVGS